MAAVEKRNIRRLTRFRVCIQIWFDHALIIGSIGDTI